MGDVMNDRWKVKCRECFERIFFCVFYSSTLKHHHYSMNCYLRLVLWVKRRDVYFCSPNVQIFYTSEKFIECCIVLNAVRTQKSRTYINLVLVTLWLSVTLLVVSSSLIIVHNNGRSIIVLRLYLLLYFFHKLR